MKTPQAPAVPLTLEHLEARIAPASLDVGSGVIASGSVAFEMPDTFSVALLADNPAPPPASISGQLQVTGSVTIDGANLDLTLGHRPEDLDFFTIISNDDLDPIVGHFAGLPQGTVFPVGDSFFKISYLGGDGNDVELTAFAPDLEISSDGHTATFTDVDGDDVSVKTSRGQFTPEMFELIPTGNFVGGSALQTIKVSGASDFAGAKISITAKRGAFGGNGAVNLEKFDATGINLNKVTLDGALGFILAGSGANGTPAIKKLTAQSLGAFGISSIPQNGLALASELNGDLGKLIITSDIRDTSFRVMGSANSISVRGSVIDSQLHADFDFGSIKITGDLLGTSAGSAVISAFGQKSAPTVGSDVAIKTLSVGGRIENARILAGYNQLGDAVNADGSIGAIKTGTDWIASTVHAGTTAGTDGFDGTADDAGAAGDGVRDQPDLFSQIAKIKIAGQAYGSAATDDSFGIMAEEFRKVQIGQAKLPLTRGPFADFFYAAPTGPSVTGELSDFAIFEVQPVV